MKILVQMGLLFGLYWVSQWIEALLPFAFPASVIGLVLLLVLLVVKALRVEQVRTASDFLLGNLPFFFIPVSVGVMNYKDQILSNGAAFLTICFVSLVVTFGVTAWVVQWTIRLMERRRKR